MKSNPLWTALALLTAIALGAAARAEDIDIFLANTGGATKKPNVMFLLDNSANWGATLYKNDGVNITKRHVVHQALHRVLTSARFVNTVRTGLMTFAHGNSPKGGKVIAALRDLDPVWQSILAQMLYPGGLYAFDSELLPGANNAPVALLLNESYRYYQGDVPRSGLQDGDHDPLAIAGGRYRSPVDLFSDPCGSNFVILIANGEPDSGENNDAGNLLDTLGGRRHTDPVSLDPNNFEANWGDEFARFMAGADIDASQDGAQNIITYVIDIFDPAEVKTKPDRAARAFLQSVAKQGRGRYFAAKNVDEVTQAIIDILNELQAVNSVFAAVNLPVSVNVRGTHLNQVYMGMFRPDARNRPRWYGNLKLYKLLLESGTGSVFMADKNGLGVHSPATGFIVGNAQSYWSQPSAYWSFEPRGTPPSASDAPDGEVVEKGAAGQRLRLDWPNRQLYTCTGGCGAGSLLSSTPFETGNAAISQAALGAADAAERDLLINWMRGADNQDEDSDGDTGEVRPSIHGDVLHSRPAVINYNRTGNDNDDVVVFYGANDGVFHAVKGGMADTGGAELWGFVPAEFLGRLKRLRDNTPVSADNGPKPYFIDGSITTYMDDVNGDGQLDAGGGDKVHLFLTLRRGGRFIYALDVSTPEQPRFLWKRAYTDSGYGELGQTWSAPQVAKIDLNGTARVVLVFGAGYDPAADDALPAGVATMGRGILVVDAATGDVIWQAGPNPSGGSYRVTVPDMVYSIPSDVTLLNRDGDSQLYADRAYVGDTGGNVWRVDMADPNPGNWAVHKLAAAGGAGAKARKFLYAPAVVYDEDDAGPYDGVYIGAGDREHPFDTGVLNRFYMFKDRYTGPSGAGQTTIVEADLYDATDNLVQVGTDGQRAAASADLLAARGWYVDLRSGEKVVGGVVVVGGSVFFSTNQPAPPDPDTCHNLGIARSYVLNFRDGSASIDWDGADGLTTLDRFVVMPGGGLPPSPVAVLTELDGKLQGAVVIGTWVVDRASPSDVRRRVFWYKEME